ncbi:ribonucleotide reductase [Acinetobacter phage SH-Ab 15599]|nr:ribonucleotide reductase [Acinetobacter phage SH-Ab 15599]
MSNILIKDSSSPLFQDSLVYRPFHYMWAQTMFQEHEKIHWIPGEAQMQDDHEDWANNLTEDEKKFIKLIFAVFTTGDVVVAKNYKKCFLTKYENNEASNLLMSIAAREAIHQEAYALAAEIFNMDDSIFAAFHEYKEMKERLEGMFFNFDCDTVDQLAINHAHSVIDEGVGLFGVFVSLLQFMRRDKVAFNGKRGGRLKGFSKINAWSLRDETLHTDANVKFFQQLTYEHPIVNDKFKKEIYELNRRFIQVEDTFLDRAHRALQLDTFSLDENKAYMRFMSNRRMVQMGLKPEFTEITTNPCSWIDPILTENKVSSFFETKVSSYQVDGAIVGKFDLNEMLALGQKF